MALEYAGLTETVRKSAADKRFQAAGLGVPDTEGIVCLISLNREQARFLAMSNCPADINEASHVGHHGYGCETGVMMPDAKIFHGGAHA